MFLSLMLKLDAYLDGWLPEAIRADPDQHARARFLLQCSSFGLLVSCIMSVVYVVTGLWPLALSVTAFGVLTMAIFWVLRLSKNYPLTANIALGLALVAMIFPTFAEPGLDGTVIVWFGAVPYLALMFLGVGRSFFWLLVSLVFIAVYLFWHLSSFAPVGPALPLTATVMRAFFLMVTIFVFAVRFELDRQWALSSAQHAQKVRSIFIANMSHELRTPMNGVIGMAEVMLQGATEPQQRESLQVIRTSGQAVVSLINNLLDLTRTESGKLKLSESPFSPAQVTREVALLFTPEAGKKGVQVRIDIDPAVPEIMGDSLRLRQVLTNLVSNAVKFTSTGTVQVGLRRDADTLTFSVQDTGIGISAEQRPRLFRSFEQVDPTIARNYGGSGLGLALSRQLVQLMGGELTLDATVTSGARFVFKLPIREGSPGSPVYSSLTPVPMTLKQQRKVLIVDDNEVNLKVAQALVERAGYQVETAANGHQAVAAVQRSAFLAVLMDCQMPEMDGHQATRIIRQLPGQAARVPIVALTASALDEDLRACRLSGMNDCLTKPVSFETVSKVLRKLAT